MARETKSKDLVIYQLLIEDVQLEALQSLGIELSDWELREVRHKLCDFIHWNFYVREAIRAVLEENDGDIWNRISSSNEYWDFLGGKLGYEEMVAGLERAGIEMRPEIDEYFSKFK